MAGFCQRYVGSERFAVYYERFKGKRIGGTEKSIWGWLVAIVQIVTLLKAAIFRWLGGWETIFPDLFFTFCNSIASGIARTSRVL